jgi:hypothetical protein
MTDSTINPGLTVPAPDTSISVDTTSTVDPLIPTSPDPTPIPPSDPILTQLESRARDLSLSIVNPATFAKKLRETLIETVGPERSKAYHIGASFDGEKVDFNISYLSSTLLISLVGDTNRDLTLGLSYHRTTQGGWNVEVGVEATIGRGVGQEIQEQIRSGLKSSFSVTISK